MCASRERISTRNIRKLRVTGKTAVVIPARNEHEQIGWVVATARAFAEMVLVVDDGSTDATSREARRAGAEVLRNSRPRGLGAALGKGFSRVFAYGFPLAVSIDGDGAHDPTAIPRIVNHHLRIGADITIGSRLIVNRTPAPFPSAKECANRFASLLLRKVTGTRITDVASGFRVVNSAVLTLPRLSRGYGYSFELICAATASDLAVGEYPIRVRYDARDLLATRIIEILALLHAAKKYARRHRHILTLHSLIRSMRAQKKVTVRLAGSEFILHPLREHASYLIQEQSMAFLRATPQGRIWDFDI